MRAIICAVLCILVFISCGDSSSSSQIISQKTRRNSRDPLVVCPVCNGTGIFSYMPGDFMAPTVKCSACGGKGVCTASTAKKMIEMRNEVNSMMNGGNQIIPNQGGRRSGRSAYEIQNDLNKAYQLLNSMEENYRNCTSVVVAAQYPNMIANQKERIRQLEAELRNAR